MAVHFNHTILSARDSRASAKFLAEMLGLPAPVHWGPFEVVTTANGANLDYMEARRRDHAAALRVSGRRCPSSTRSSRGSRSESCPTGRTPARRKPGEINRHDGGRGCYFEDPNGHLLEIITRPYGSGGWNP